MKRFKPGDKVVRLERDFVYDILKKGQAYTFHSYSHSLSNGDWKIMLFETDNTYDSNFFELEEVYNSPLYQALL